ncbi:methyl-accepting chemotaxis protein [Bacillaceae bacterium IKA-2]|nr:methyl-accepting chemotaxis protein [Bacillaceae bacterium IKA-2]
MGNLKMRTKLIIMFIVTGLIPIVILGFILENRAELQMRNAALQENNLFFALKSEAINNYYNERRGDGLLISGISDIVEGLEIIEEQGENSEEWQQKYRDIERLLYTAIGQYEFSDVFLTNKSGDIVISSQYGDVLEGLNIIERNYLQKALSGIQNWSELFFSDLIGDNTVVLSTPIYSRGSSNTVLGTVNIFVDQETIDSIVHTEIERIGESGNAYVVNEDGLLLTNTRLGEYAENAAMEIEIDTEVTRISSSALIDQNYAFEFTDTYKNYLGREVLGSAGVVRIGETYGTLIIEVDEAEALSSLITSRNITFVLVAIAGTLGLVAALYFATTISRPITVAVEESNVIASLDIRKDIPEKLLGRKDEIGDLSKALQSITNSLREVISEISQSAEQVSASSEELTATSHQSSVGIIEVAKTVGEIAIGASEQASNTEEGSSKAVLLGETIANDQAYMKELNEASVRVNKVVEEGLIEIKNLTKITEESSKGTREVQQGIINTNDSAKKISEASSVIASIANQTNLLALNAAIEAARAGEAGKGFSVVADEIRKLAEQSTKSTQTIDEVVAELQSNSNSAVEIMERVAAILIEQDSGVKESQEKYVTISKAMKEAEMAVEKLNVSGAEMEKMKDAIVETLQNLSAIAEENSASTEEVSTSMQEQSASIEDISRASEGLSELAQNLQSIIMKFKV